MMIATEIALISLSLQRVMLRFASKSSMSSRSGSCNPETRAAYPLVSQLDFKQTKCICNRLLAADKKNGAPHRCSELNEEKNTGALMHFLSQIICYKERTFSSPKAHMKLLMSCALMDLYSGNARVWENRNNRPLSGL